MRLQTTAQQTRCAGRRHLDTEAAQLAAFFFGVLRGRRGFRTVVMVFGQATQRAGGAVLCGKDPFRWRVQEPQ